MARKKRRGRAAINLKRRRKRRKKRLTGIALCRHMTAPANWAQEF